MVEENIILLLGGDDVMELGIKDSDGIVFV